MAEKVTIEEKNNLYNKVVNVINQMIPGQMLDLPVASTITKQQVQYNIRDSEGNIVETLSDLPDGYKEGRKIYKNEDGSWTYSPTSKVSLDESTGKITVTAPDFILERDGFKDQFGPQLETLSRYYQQSPMSTIPQADGSYKTIPQIINELNDPDNPSSLPKYTEAILSMQDQELGYKDKDGNIYEGDRKVYNIPDEIKLNDNYFMLRNTIAVGDGVTDTTLQAVPKNLAQADFLRNLQSYDKDTGTVQYKDLMDNAYNLSVEGVQNESERLKQLKAGLEEYFAQGDYTDTDEFARSVALYEFITHKAPDAKWYQTVAYTVVGWLDGTADYLMQGNVFSPASIARASVAAYEAADTLLSTAANFAKTGELEKKSFIDSVFSMYKEKWDAFETQNQEDRLYLMPQAAAAREIGYNLASLISLIAAGNAMEKGAKTALEGVATKAGTAAGKIATAGERMSELDYLSSGMKLAVTTSNTANTARLANVVYAISSAKTTSTIAGLLAETFGEAITGNPDKFYRVLNSGELTEEAKEQLWEDFIGNSIGLAGGVTIGKAFIKIGESTKGRAISMNLSRDLAKVTTAIGDEWAQAIAKAHGVDNIKDYIAELNKAGKVEKAQALLIQELLRDVKKAIADQDAIKVFGRSEEDVLKSIQEVESDLHVYRAFENAVDEFNRRGLGIAAEWLDPVRNVKLSKANDAMQEVYESLRKAEKSSNLTNVTSVGKLAISKETTNYISALIKRDIVNSAIKVLAGDSDRAEDVAELKKELEKANGVISGYESLVGGNQNLLQTAKKYTESLKKFYAEMNNVLVKEGLINQTELEGLRASGLWGENGELYAHFQRDTAKEALSPLNFYGSFRHDTVEYIKNYVHGSDLDYMDPLVTSRLYIRRYADKAARQDVVRQYIAATGCGEELMGAAQTEAATILSKALRNKSEVEFAHAAQKTAEEIRAGGPGKNDDLIKLFVNLNPENNRLSSLDKKFKKSVSEYNARVKADLGDAVFFPTRSTYNSMALNMNNDELNDAWQSGMEKAYGETAGGKNITTYKFVSDNYGVLPQNAKSYINESFDVMNYASGRSTGIKVVLNTWENTGEDGAKKLVQKELGKVQEIVNTGRGRAADVVEKYFTEAGQKEALKRALRRNGLSENFLNPNNALFIKDFEGKDAKQIQRILNDVYGEKAGTAIWNRAHLEPNGKRRKLDATIRKLRKSANEVFLNRYGTQMTKRGQSLYLDMVEHQTKMVLTEDLKKLRELSYENFEAVKKVIPGFEDQLKRMIIGGMAGGNDSIFNLEQPARKFKREQAIADLAKRMFVNDADYTELAEALKIPNELFAAGVDAAVDKYIENVLSYPGTKAAYDELIKYYGLDEANAKEYLALRSLMEHKPRNIKGKNITTRGALAREIKREVREEEYNKLKVKIEDSDRPKDFSRDEYISGRINDAIWKRIEERYDDMRLEMIEQAPVFVSIDNMYDEVEGLTTKISQYKKDVDNVVAIQDETGRVSFMKTDPLLATVMNHEAVIKPLGAFEKANYLLSKTFRLGTTSLNLKSLVNQTFRDFGNAFIGGNLYRTWSRAKLDMQSVLGNNVVDWIRRSDDDLADFIVKEAQRTGKAEADVAYDMIRRTGSNLAPTTTETDVYRRATEVNRSMRMERNKGVNKLTGSELEGVTRGIDKIGDNLGKANEWREKTLRNMVFQNGFADAVKRGYSFEQAKQYATFLMNNATTNFGRTTAMFARMQRTVPFLGAAINGTKSFYRLLSVDPVGVIGRLIGGIIIPTAYLTSGSLLTAEDRKLWRSIKEYQKDDNILFVSNGNVYSIPIPQEISAWVNPIRHIIEINADANVHSIMQLAVNDILGLSPIDLDGFANIDANMLADGTDSDNFFVNNVEPGLAKLFSQLAPVPMKAGMMYATGIDPYTMKKIDKTYSTVNIDTGEVEIMGDYSSSFAKGIASFLSKIDGFEMSAPMAEKLLGSIIGTAPVEYLGWLVDMKDAAIGKKDIVDALSSSAEGVVNMVASPITVPIYKSRAEEDWKAAVSEMYNQREALLMSDAWQDYQNKKRNATTAEELTKLAAVRDNLTRGYYEQLKAMVDNLQSKYEADFTAEKYAAVISLSVLDQTGVDSTAYGQNLSDELYKDAKNRAIDTMYRMGFNSPSDYSVFGYLKTGQDGEPYVAMSTPMAILQLRDNMNYAKGLHQANMSSILESRGLQKNSDSYRAMQSQVDAIYSKGNLESADYDAISAIYKQWDAQVMAALYPYLKQYGIDNVLENSDTVEFLNDVIKVPSDFAKTKQGRYFSSPGLNKQAGYAKAYIEYVYNLLEEQ